MRASPFVLLALTAALIAPQAAATGWEEAPHSRARLIAAGEVEPDTLAGRAQLSGPALLAGLEIHLDPGWKTYWRTAGDGIAPQFDWSGSQNVAATRVLWPAPDHFRDMAGEYNGYAERVVLPVLVVLEQPGAQVALDLGLDYAVCKDVCIPVSKTLSLRFSPDDASGRDAVLGALRKAPVRAGADGRCGALTLADVRAELDGPSPELEVTFSHPPGASPDDLFVEAESGQFMPHPARAESRPERTVFRLDPGAGGDPRALVGKSLTFTAAAKPRSCEITWTVE